MDHRTLRRRGAALLLAGCLAFAAAGCSAPQQDAPAEPTEAPAEPAPTPEPAEPTVPETPDTPPVTAVNVEPIEGLPEDFIRGVDISSLPAELESGVVYHDFDGNAITDMAAFCQLLADSGITHVRVRVWNDPFDADHNGYGGGNNDVTVAAALAECCKEAGLHMLVDFHLSDFWADPAKQMAPKAWEGMTTEQTCDAIADFITDALEGIELVAPGVVDSVQVGNETTGGIAGLSGNDAMCAAFSAGVGAVHSFGESAGRDVAAVIHLTNPEKGTFTSWAKVLDEHSVPYDILATSYYPYWHGDFDNLIAELSAVRETYGKQVMVAETSYANTLTDTDGSGNTVAVGSNDTGPDLHWSFSVQGQTVFLRDLMEAVYTAGGIGVYYWEPAWITVGDITHGASAADNQKKWEQFGSGWASSYAAAYDPDDAGKYYGGSAVDNQAFFDAAGRALASLKFGQYAYTGCENPDLAPEEWLEGTGGTAGTGGEAITAEGNLIPAAMASFDDGSGYTVDGAAVSAIPNSEDPYEGKNDLHWWSESENVRNTVTTTDPITLTPGAYTASIMAQGYEGDLVMLQILGTDGTVLAESETYLTGWADWHELTVDYTADAETAVQVCIVIDTQIGGWGTCDLLTLTPAA